MTLPVLVTGMSGLIGSAFRRQVGAGYELSALNRSLVDGVSTTQASLSDFDAIRPAFEGQHTVVHLAAEISDSAGWDALLQTNVVGTRNVLEASVQAGVKRVVFTSSGATVSGWEQEEPYKALVEGRYDDVKDIPLINESMATRPANQYAATKVWGESIARHYSQSHGLEVICLRIGFANANDKPDNARQFSVWNSHRDVVSALDLSINLNVSQVFDTFFILSDNRWGYRNIERARSVLGFVPQDRAEDHRLAN
jgi:nucleoside-diphosphate-sugar epimerase